MTAKIVKVYKYAIMPPDEDTRKQLLQQLQLANNYYNKLIELARDTRVKVFAKQSEYSDIKTIEDELKEKSDEIERLEDELKALRKITKKRSETKEQRDNIKEKRELRKITIVSLKEEKEKLKNNNEYNNFLTILNDEVNIKKKELRKNSGVYWGTYLLIQESVDAAVRTSKKDLPRFRSRERSNILGIQVQNGKKISELNNKSSLFQIDLPPYVRKKDIVPIKYRINSGEKCKPIFVDLNMIYHRKFPEDCEVKWIKLVRRVIADKEKWFINFSLEIDCEVRTLGENDKKIAIDLSWRKMGNSLRVGYSFDGENSEEFKLPGRICGAFDKVSSLQGIRDNLFNELKPSLKLLKSAPDDWYYEYIHTDRHNLMLSESKYRWSDMVVRWRDDRWAGDDEIFNKMEEWRKREKHLLQYQGNLLDQTLAARKNYYHNIGSRLTKEYNILILEKINFASLHRRKKIGEEEDDTIKIVKKHQRWASPSEMTSVLENAFIGRGLAVMKVPAENNSTKCNKCGAINKNDNYLTECKVCGSIYDVNENAACNILEKYNNGDILETKIAVEKKPKWQ